MHTHKYVQRVEAHITPPSPCLLPLVTVIEILPKDKKGKDQTWTPLGQVSVDLLPLLRGQTRLNLLVDLHAIPGSPLDTLEAPKVEMEITIQV